MNASLWARIVPLAANTARSKSIDANIVTDLSVTALTLTSHSVRFAVSRDVRTLHTKNADAAAVESLEKVTKFVPIVTTICVWATTFPAYPTMKPSAARVIRL